MEWNGVKVTVAGRTIEFFPIPYTDGVIEGAPVVAEIVKLRSDELESIRALMPYLNPPEPFASALFTPGEISDPMEWLLRWCEGHGLRLISDDPLDLGNRWLVHFAGIFPSTLPDELVRVTLEW